MFCLRLFGCSTRSSPQGRLLEPPLRSGRRWLVVREACRQAAGGQPPAPAGAGARSEKLAVGEARDVRARSHGGCAAKKSRTAQGASRRCDRNSDGARNSCGSDAGLHGRRIPMQDSVRPAEPRCGPDPAGRDVRPVRYWSACRSCAPSSVRRGSLHCDRQARDQEGRSVGTTAVVRSSTGPNARERPQSEARENGQVTNSLHFFSRWRGRGKPEGGQTRPIRRRMYTL